jgi:hypothetical protein
MRYRAAALAIFLPLAWLAYVYPRAGVTKGSSGIESGQQRGSQISRRRGAARVDAPPRINYSKFSHSIKAHQQDCSACHKFPSKNWKEVRKADSAFADITEYPEHSSCIKCHSQQFFARERPAPRVCSICHVAVTPRYTERHPFPNPPEIFNVSKRAQGFVSDFRISFPHETHLELVGENTVPNGREEVFRFWRASLRQEKKADESEKSCAFCHQTYQPQGKSDEEFVTARPKGLADNIFWLKKGTFKTIPNHATCFTCHTPEGDMKPASIDCAACHKLQPPGQSPRFDFDPKLAAMMGITDGNILTKWRRRSSSGTFRHEGGLHPDQECVTCHKVSAMNTLDVKTLKVPVTACDVCHIGESADEAALNFEIEKRKADPAFQCTKCHLNFGKEPIPESHLKAMPKAKAK